jgi:hypothetical protein
VWSFWTFIWKGFPEQITNLTIPGVCLAGFKCMQNCRNMQQWICLPVGTTTIPATRQLAWLTCSVRRTTHNVRSTHLCVLCVCMCVYVCERVSVCVNVYVSNNCVPNCNLHSSSLLAVHAFRNIPHIIAPSFTWTQSHQNALENPQHHLGNRC